MRKYNFLLILLTTVGFSLFFTACTEDEVVTPQLTPLACDYFNTDRILVDDPDLAVDYIIDCVMDVNADVVIQPGVVIEFAADAGLYVRETGSLSAVGTASAPITLTGTTKAAGSWKGILFNSNNVLNRLEFTDINFAGSGEFNSNGDIAAVVIWGDARLSMHACSITASDNYGITAIYNGSNFSVTETTITDCNNAPINMLPDYVDALDGSNLLMGNAEDFITMDISFGNITTDKTMVRSSVPYKAYQGSPLFNVFTINGGNFTINPGVTIFFDGPIGFEINEDASLIAAGTVTNPITFTSEIMQAGAWAGIYFDRTNNVLNRIENAIISYAGADLWGYNGESAGVLMWGNPTVALNNVSFDTIDGCAIFNFDTAANPNLNTNNISQNNTLGLECFY